MKKDRRNPTKSFGTSVAHAVGSTEKTATGTIARTVGRGRGVCITETHFSQADIEAIFQGESHPPRPVAVTHYKPTREQQYAALGRMYGVERKPAQSLRAYARAVDKAIATAIAERSKRASTFTNDGST